MQNAGLDEAQAGIKITGRNIHNLRYADDMTIMAESREKRKTFSDIQKLKQFIKTKAILKMSESSSSGK